MDEITERILNAFLDHFTPANDLSESDEQMTTEQIFEKISSFYPDADFGMDELFQKLEEAGFKYEWIQDEFKWMLKEKV